MGRPLYEGNDLHWGYTEKKKEKEHHHTDGFQLENFHTMEAQWAQEDEREPDFQQALNVQKALERDMALSDTALISRFESLAFLTAGLGDIGDILRLKKPEMVRNNLDMVDVFVKNQSAAGEVLAKVADSEPIEFPALATKVFDRQEVKDFMAPLISAYQTRKLQAGLGGKVPLADIKPSLPSFGGNGDKVNGLMFSVHTLHAGEVREDYVRQTSAGYEAGLSFILYDHFGLDYKDIREFGTARLVMEKLPINDPMVGLPFSSVWALVGGGISTYEAVKLLNPDSSKKDDSEQDLRTAVGVGFAVLAGIFFFGSLVSAGGMKVCADVAAGFRAWFILQHYRGCKPFITQMTHTETVSLGVI